MNDRPRLHFTPSRGWVNDPHGLTWHDGRYHLFFQHVPGAARWEPGIHWGHATSPDLVTWTEEPVVLAPGEGDGGVWSGCVVREPGGAGRLFYTSVDADSPDLGRVRAADPTDATWLHWRKGEVVVTPPAVPPLSHFRDPAVVHDGTRWRMVVGGGTAAGEGVVLTWVSDDLVHWHGGTVLASRPEALTDPLWTGSVWECPQLLRVDDRWVLLVSVWEGGETQHEVYAVGELVDDRFEVAAWHRLTYGPAHYAGSAFTDATGSPCLLHWMRGVADPAGDWAGAHSVPHALSLHGDRLVARPHPAVAAHCAPLAPGEEMVLGEASVRHAGTSIDVRTSAEEFAMPCAPDDSVQLLVDGPVVEVFATGGVAGFACR